MSIWSEPLAGTELKALLAAVRRSPIFLRPVLRLIQAARELLPLVRSRSPLAAIAWLNVRKSGNADAFVLAWIASHPRGRRRSSPLM